MRKEMSSVNDQRWRWCEQDHAIVSVESSTSSDQQQRTPDVHRNSVDMMAQPADDWQQNADVALIQLQRLERSEQPGTAIGYIIYHIAKMYSISFTDGWTDNIIMPIYHGENKWQSLCANIFWEIMKESFIPVDITSCLACEYDANCAAFTTIALATVGKQPYVRHRIIQMSPMVVKYRKTSNRSPHFYRNTWLLPPACIRDPAFIKTLSTCYTRLINLFHT